MPEILDFQKAITIAENMSDEPPAALLGNGFSIAYESHIFSYRALFEAADWSDASCIKRVFSQLGTTDFERVMSSLELTANIVDIYEPGPLVDKVRWDADRLKWLLIDAITRTHPETIFKVDARRMQRTITFLRH